MQQRPVPAALKDAQEQRIAPLRLSRAMSEAPARSGQKKARTKRQSTPKKVKEAFQSIRKERSVAFNLTLDVQNIRQEIQSLILTRDLLLTRIVHRRHEPSGSLMLKVKGFYDAFRQGWAISDGRRKFPRSPLEQRDFLSYVMDENVWIGNNMNGVANMVQQMEINSTSMRIIDLRMHGYSIVDTEDSVVIKSSGVLRFQIVRATIFEIFPHVLRHEDLFDRLIDRQVEAPIAYTFYFDAKGVISRNELDLDMVGTFTSLLRDPKVVALLLGRALIYENCKLGLYLEDEAHGATEGSIGDPEAQKAPSTTSRSSSQSMRLEFILD